MSMHRTARTALASLALAAALVAAPARAAVTDLYVYHLGEAGSLGTNNRPIDSVSGNNFTNNFSTGTSVDTADPAPGDSTADLVVPSGKGFYGVSTAFPTDNFGIELWVKTADLAQSKDIFVTNSYNSQSLKFTQLGTALAASYQGVSWIGPTNGVSGAVTANEWIHLAIVRDGGVSSFYIDGVKQGGTTTTAPTTSASGVHIAVQPGGITGTWNGAMDELRVFTFTTGAFSVSDLSYINGSDFANGSFEASSPLTLKGWSASGNLGLSTSEGTTDGTHALVFNGGNAAVNGFVEQTFATNPGSSYRVTFDFGKFGSGGGSAGIQTLVYDYLTGIGSPFVNDPVFDSTYTNIATEFNTFFYNFTATGSLTTLRFTDASTGTISFDAVLDNIHISLLPTPAALPAGLTLLTLLSMRRRR